MSGPMKSLLMAAVVAMSAPEVIRAGTAPGCVNATPGVQQMTPGELRISPEQGNGNHLDVLVATSAEARAAGFQHICPETVAHTAILFRFERDTRTPFHMRNVHAPLDIAFIDTRGVVVDLQRMEPYVASVVFARQPRYQSQAPFRFALETAAGRMKELGIAIGTRLRLE